MTMIQITERGNRAKPIVNAAIDKALLRLAHCLDFHGRITEITATRVVVNLNNPFDFAGLSGITFSGSGEAFLPMILAARNALIFGGAVQNAYDLQMHWMKRQPRGEQTDLCVEPRPAPPWGSHDRIPGTIAVAFTLGVRNRGGLEQIANMTRDDRRATLEMMATEGVWEVAQELGISTAA